jgi:serine/threonine-protein kinase
MLTGRLPYEAATVAEFAHFHMTALPPAPSSLNPAVPPHVDTLVLQAMAKDPQRRFDSANTLRAMLQAALALTDLAPSISTVPPHPTATPAETQVLTEGAAEEEKPVWRQITQSALAMLGGMFLGLLAVSVIVYYLLVGTRPREVVVPDVTGLPLTEAQRLLEERGLHLRVLRREPHRDIPPDHIVRMEDPEPNRRVVEGREVLVVVSQGVTPATVPDVTGQKVADAIAALKSARLRVGQRVEAFSETAPAGTVIGQQPPPLTQVPEDTPVHLIVSKGAPPPEPEVNWRDLPPDAKVARVAIVVGGTQLQQVVQIQVTDADGTREVYRGVHVPGDRVSKTVVVRGSGRIRVLVNGKPVAPDQEL